MKFNRPVKAFIAIGLMILLIAAGCAAPAASPTTTPSGATTTPPTTTPVKTTPPVTQAGPSGRLRVGISTFGGEGWDPITQTGTTMSNMIGPIYEQMFRLDEKTKGPAPGIIEKWEIAADGLSWTYQVRKGIKFNNGEDLKADDIKFSIDRYITEPIALYSATLRSFMERTEVVDEYTVRIYTKGPQPYLPNHSWIVLPQYMVVMPKDYIEQRGIESFKLAPVGSGPFKFVRHFAGDMVEYEAQNTHYRQTSAFKNLFIILMPEETTRVAGLKTGEIDIIDVGMESAQELEAAGFKTPTMMSTVPSVFFYGSLEPSAAGMPIADIRVRQAMSLAIDREEIGKTFFYGKLGPPTPPGLTQNVLDVDVPYWLDYCAKIYRYDPQEAQKLLNEAGYSNGFTLKFFSFTTSGSPYVPKLNEIIQSYWAKVKIKAEIVPTDWGTVKPLLYRTPPAPVLLGNVGTFAHSENPLTPSQLRVPFHSENSMRLAGKQMLELDKLLDSAISEIDTTKREDLIAKAIKMGTDAYLSLVIGTAPAQYAVGSSVAYTMPTPSNGVALYLEYAKHK